jgi:hypothetical protein
MLGLYQMGARYYQPGTGRFTQADPLPSSVFEANRYEYAYSNPANYTDPTGLCPICIVVVAVGLWGIAIHNADQYWESQQTTYDDYGNDYSTYYSRKSGKERASDTPSWFDKGTRAQPGESPVNAAKRVLDERYGPGAYPTGPGSEFNKIKKFLERNR